MTKTTTFCVSGGRLQRSRVLKNPSLCRPQRPEPLPRAMSSPSRSLAGASAPSACSSCGLARSRRSLSPPHHTAALSSTAALLPRSSASPATVKPSRPKLCYAQKTCTFCNLVLRCRSKILLNDLQRGPLDRVITHCPKDGSNTKIKIFKFLRRNQGLWTILAWFF